MNRVREEGESHMNCSGSFFFFCFFNGGVDDGGEHGGYGKWRGRSPSSIGRSSGGWVVEGVVVGRGLEAGGAAGVSLSQGQVDPPHAHLLLTPPSSTLILTQTCHVRVLVFVISAAPLVTSPTERRRQRAA